VKIGQPPTMKETRLDALLQLRAWAFDVLLRGLRIAAPRASSQEWMFFLRIERCAAELQRVAGELLNPEAACTVQPLALAELRRAMGVRAQLRDLDELARTHGWTVVVTKAGAEPRSDVVIDMMDIDVFTDESTLVSMTSWYEARGSTIVPDSAGVMITPPESGHGLVLDVQTMLREMDYGSERAETAPPYSALRRMNAVDHVWLMLLHSTITHGTRRGCLRDLLLLRLALARCSRNQLDELDRRILGHTHAAMLADTVSVATSDGADVFRRSAAFRYAVLRRTGLEWSGHVKYSIISAALESAASSAYPTPTRVLRHGPLRHGMIREGLLRMWRKLRSALTSRVVSAAMRDAERALASSDTAWGTGLRSDSRG
jgi:hypothetical protein